LIRFPVGPSFRCSPRHPNSTKVDFSWKIPRRRISSNGMIRYYCPSPKIRKPQSAFPIRFFIGRKTFRSLECPPKFKARQDTERPNPKKALLKHPSIGIRPFYRPTAEKLPKRLKTSKKKEKSVRTSPARKLAAAPLAIQSFFTRCTGGQTIKASPVR